MDATCEDRAAELVDVTGIGIADLRAMEDSALAHSLRRILAELDSADGVVAGWQSAI